MGFEFALCAIFERKHNRGVFRSKDGWQCSRISGTALRESASMCFAAYFAKVGESL